MIRLLITLATSVLVVYAADRVANSLDPVAWRAHKDAARGRLVQAARGLAPVADVFEPRATLEPAAERLRVPEEAELLSESPTAASVPLSTPGPDREAFPRDTAEWAPAVVDVESRIRSLAPVALEPVDVDGVRRRLDRVMSLAAGVAR